MRGTGLVFAYFAFVCLASLVLAASGGRAALLDPVRAHVHTPVQAEGDKKGVPDRCARIVNPAERRRCIQQAGGD